MKQLIQAIVAKTEHFLQNHAAGESAEKYGSVPLTGEFGLYRPASNPDLYGMVDAVYTLYTIGRLDRRTNIESRRIWAERILACQDEDGWFSKLNLRGHSREHATAYAIGALRLLEIEPSEHYVEQMRPLAAFFPILTEHTAFLDWLEHMGFRFSVRDIAEKNLGWHYVWRGSHVGGGVAAAIAMTSHLFNQWWPGKVNVKQWFDWYFDWLDSQANPDTGFWQRGIWNRVYRRPTIIDMGGAVHFFWVYEALSRPYPYPEQVIRSTLPLQQSGGLYKDHPFCIDLDGNFCIVRSFLQLSASDQRLNQEKISRSLEANFNGIIRALADEPFESIYTNSHGLPGALAALTECTKIPDFKYAESLREWQHPLDRTCWL